MISIAGKLRGLARSRNSSQTANNFAFLLETNIQCGIVKEIFTNNLIKHTGFQFNEGSIPGFVVLQYILALKA